jgi:hypothetical protein
LNRGDLEGIEREAVDKGLGLEILVGLALVALEQLRKSLGCVPTIEGMAQVLGAAQIAEPDAAAGGELAQVWASIGGEDEGQAVLPPGTAGGLRLLGQREMEDDADLTRAMVRSVAEMQGEDEDYEGLLGELYDGLLDELADLARGSEGLSEE